MRKLFIISLLAVAAAYAPAQNSGKACYEAQITQNIATGDFAPYYMSSNVHGTITQPLTTQLRARVRQEFKPIGRFSIAWGADLIGQVAKKTAYQAYDAPTQQRYAHKEGVKSFVPQQIYVEAKYRGVFATVGMKERGSYLLNDSLSSGDVVMSANSRPMPGVRAGFFNPQPIPFTHDWAYIQGEVGFYKQLDNSWNEHHFNFENQHIIRNVYFNYSYITFMSNPAKPFMVQASMQHATQFGGDYTFYQGGKVVPELTKSYKVNLKTIIHCLIPGSGDTSGDQFYEGNHVGSLDLAVRYRFSGGAQVRAYMEHPWEDGSGMRFGNGADGLYGLEVSSPAKWSWLKGLVMEYFDFTNQSGPIHYAPADNPSSSISTSSTGADDYYNNYAYNGYQYYGMSLGSPMLKSPLFYQNGQLIFGDNRVRGFHIAARGMARRNLAYRAMLSYRRSWGSAFMPADDKRTCTSAMVEVTYHMPQLKGLAVKAQVAGDRGRLLGNNFGALATLSYTGKL